MRHILRKSKNRVRNNTDYAVHKEDIKAKRKQKRESQFLKSENVSESSIKPSFNNNNPQVSSFEVPHSSSLSACENQKYQMESDNENEETEIEQEIVYEVEEIDPENAEPEEYAENEYLEREYEIEGIDPNGEEEQQMNQVEEVHEQVDHHLSQIHHINQKPFHEDNASAHKEIRSCTYKSVTDVPIVKLHKQSRGLHSIQDGDVDNCLKLEPRSSNLQKPQEHQKSKETYTDAEVRTHHGHAKILKKLQFVNPAALKHSKGIVAQEYSENTNNNNKRKQSFHDEEDLFDKSLIPQTVTKRVKKEAKNKIKEYGRALNPYTKKTPRDVTISKNETVVILDRNPKMKWKIINSQGDEGYVPAKCIQLLCKNFKPEATEE